MQPRLSKLAALAAIVGGLSMVPCWLSAIPGGAFALLLSAIALLRTLGKTTHLRGRNVALAGLVMATLGILIGVGQFYYFGHRAPRPGQEAFNVANSFVNVHKGTVADGNTKQARDLAAVYSRELESRVRESFTGFKDSPLSMSDNKHLVYCHLSDEQVVFLVHVPELRRYEGDVRADLRVLAWETACELTTGEEIPLVLGLRGAMVFESRMSGANTDARPTVKKSASNRSFYPYFEPGPPTRVLSFKSLGATVYAVEPPEPGSAEPPAP
jgi:hypothetical protein